MTDCGYNKRPSNFVKMLHSWVEAAEWTITESTPEGQGRIVITNKFGGVLYDETAPTINEAAAEILLELV